MTGGALPDAREDHGAKYPGNRTDRRTPAQPWRSPAAEDSRSVRGGTRLQPAIDTCLQETSCLLLIPHDLWLCVSSGAWQKLSITLHRQWTALIRPLERFGHCLIEVGNKGQDALP